MQNEIEEIEKLIAGKLAKLSAAEQESRAWNSGKYKGSSNAELSRVYIQSLRRDIAALYERLDARKR